MPTIPTSNRQGALPLHLMLAMLPWLASRTALPLSKSGLSGLSLPQEKSLPPAAKRLSAAWQELLADPKLAQAAEREARKRAVEFLEGLHQYQQTEFTRDVTEPESVFTCGSARLLSYGGKAGRPSVLLIPSLINRYYILDLTLRLSLARYLQGRGLNVFVVDWGTPSASELHFNCGMYVTEVIAPMAEWISTHMPGPLIPAGYCMGGLLTLGLAQIRPDLADAIALLATPWDFQVPQFPRFTLTQSEVAGLERHLASYDSISAETIHTLFQCANPYAFQNKLRNFSRMDKHHPATQEFLAIEHWVNDGVPMARGVAIDCLANWTQRNLPAQGLWRVGGQVVNPAGLKMPCLLAVPQGDRIVPAACSLPLAKLLRKATLIEPHGGHVSMMVGARRKAELWEPLMQWIDRQFT